MFYEKGVNQLTLTLGFRLCVLFVIERSGAKRIEQSSEIDGFGAAKAAYSM